MQLVKRECVSPSQYAIADTALARCDQFALKGGKVGAQRAYRLRSRSNGQAVPATESLGEFT
jgi:hypothetical protein